MRVALSFNKKILKRHPDLPFELSAVERIGEDLWLGSDEGTSLERLSPTGAHAFGEHSSFPLADFLVLPAGSDQEIDIEGLAYDPPYLWITGSHSLARKKPKGKNLAKDIDRLSSMTRATNRFLLARVPVRIDAKTKRSELVAEEVDASDPRRHVQASQLFGTARTNLLTDVVEDDAHLGRFLSIPGKENGFDIEGLALVGRSVFLGLRGPVLGGWAIILEVRPTELSPDYLTLAPLNRKGALYRKHFLDLSGLGIRDLCTDGDDLLILAGPTLDVSGPRRLLRWRKVSNMKGEQIVTADDLESAAELNAPQGVDVVDQAEGVCLFPKHQLLIVYDTPGEHRIAGDHQVEADLLTMPH
jgi:hypothetical protein